MNKLNACRWLPLLGCLLLSACSTVSPPGGDSYDKGDVRYSAVPFGSLPATESEDWANALRAFRLSCGAMDKKSLWREPCAAARQTPDAGARDFFRSGFDAWRVSVTTKPRDGDVGLMTGYYEPMLRGSRTPHGPYQYPLYGVPDDLIVVDLASVYPELKGLRLRGKLQGRRLVPYDSRGQIPQRRDLLDKVLCWVDDPVEAFFLHVQGAGRILLEDGSFMRVGFADQNGHPYRSLGAWLIANSELKREQMSMQRIKRWVQENPDKMRSLLNTNPSFVFFAERLGFRDEDGPLGAQGVHLTAGASVAVDRRYWPMGLPFVVSIEQSNPRLAFTRPVIAQDTGGAIKGPVRFDYFWGYGEIAGQQAGRQYSRVRSWALLPKGVRPDSLN